MKNVTNYFLLADYDRLKIVIILFLNKHTQVCKGVLLDFVKPFKHALKIIFLASSHEEP